MNITYNRETDKEIMVLISCIALATLKLEGLYTAEQNVILRQWLNLAMEAQKDNEFERHQLPFKTIDL